MEIANQAEARYYHCVKKPFAFSSKKQERIIIITQK